jgi:hypothetical protein
MGCVCTSKVKDFSFADESSSIHMRGLYHERKITTRNVLSFRRKSLAFSPLFYKLSQKSEQDFSSSLEMTNHAHPPLRSA